MKAMLLAFAAIAIIAVGADYALDLAGYSAEEQGASKNVRLD